MIELYITNQKVDVTTSVGLYLNKIYESVENPTLYFSDYSKTITLPMTTNNKIIFDNYNRQDSVITNQTIDVRSKIPFQLLYNSNLVMEGFAKLNNANTVVDDNKFEVELFSQFGLIMNELSELTFNKYDVQSNGGNKDDKYLIETPWSQTVIDRNLVKESFEQTNHNLDGNDILDYIKFLPTYQGMYPDFQSDRQERPNNVIEDLSKERDEHFTREFRSYYQTPAIFVDKLFQIAKNKIEEITDYKFNLDNSWFNSQNPYYTDLLYTCPSLYSENSDSAEQSETYNSDSLNYHIQILEQKNLSSNHQKRLYFSPEGEILNRGIFNREKLGATTFNWTGNLQFFCQNYTKKYGKIRKSNPLFVKFYAVNAFNNIPIEHSSHTVMLYSCSYNTNKHFDEKFDVGVFNDYLATALKPDGYESVQGYWFSQNVSISLNVVENVPYYIVCDAYWANNGAGLEVANSSTALKSDWVWWDSFTKGVGYHVFANLSNASVKTIDYNRSYSNLDLNRIFPKDVTLLKVLLNYCKMFGLCWDVNQDEKTISIMSRNKFFSNYEIFDWSKKLDRSHDFILEPLCFSNRYVNFNIEEGNGEKLKKYYNKYGMGYGSKTINTNYQFNNDGTDLYDGIQPSIVATKSQFSKLLNNDNPNEDTFVGYNTKVKPNEIYIDNDDEGSNAGNWGSFYFWNGTFTPDVQLSILGRKGPLIYITDDTDYQISSGEYMWNGTGTFTTECYKLPKISTISNDGWSIHFESPKEYYFEKPSGSINYIYDKFWKNFIDERYSVQSKKLTAYFYLTPEDYKRINFRQFVKIENTLYHVNRIIDYDFDTNSPTKVELVQVWNTDAYTGGQYSFPDLSVSPNTLEVDFQTYKVIDVYSSVNWFISNKPTWIDWKFDTINPNRILIKANSNPLRSRVGVLSVRTVQTQLGYYMQDNVIIKQNPLTAHLYINPPTATIPAEGGTVVVKIDSLPKEVKILSKPSWCSINIRQTDKPDIPVVLRQTFEPEPKGVDKTIITHNITAIATISVQANDNNLPRSGVVRFSNGSVERDLTIKQLGNKVVTNDDIILVNDGNSGTWTPRSDKQINPDSLTISRGTIDNLNGNVVDKLDFQFKPNLTESDEIQETSTGGVVMFRTLDERTITRNYNYGELLQNYNLVVGPLDGGTITINDVEYNSTIFESYPRGTSITLTAIPDEGKSFVKWSDNVSTPTRNILLVEDINIYPIFK